VEVVLCATVVVDDGYALELLEVVLLLLDVIELLSVLYVAVALVCDAGVVAVVV
jgi:hypothetical protein